mgnify:CR=1 FL=1
MPLAWAKALGADLNKLNVNGGAMALGHPLGATGAKLMTTLVNALAYAHGLGVTLVCASGNDGSATTVSYPAAYDAYCIAVGATRYDEAVAPMERATELMAIDPIVNDHLGDVYWSVGRFLEAEFQWKRALSFVDFGDASQEADPDRIRRKLEVGLDQVLEEEGVEPLRLADDG